MRLTGKRGSNNGIDETTTRNHRSSAYISCTTGEERYLKYRGTKPSGHHHTVNNICNSYIYDEAGGLSQIESEDAVGGVTKTV